MIINDNNLEIEKVDAFYIIRKHSCSTYIEVFSKDGNHISFTFHKNDLKPNEMELKKEYDITNDIYWDVELVTKETYYLFDISKDKIILTRLDNNLFNIKVNVEDPDMIYSPSGEGATFNNLIIDANFSFIYEDPKNR